MALHFLFLRAALPCLRRSATRAARLWNNSRRFRVPCLLPTAYSQNRGNAMVESQYATTVSGSTPGLTLPQLTASEGVAPDSPPHTTESGAISLQKSSPPFGMV